MQKDTVLCHIFLIAHFTVHESNSCSHFILTIQIQMSTDYLCGIWKRTLTWRSFGEPYAPLRTTNLLIIIEEFNADKKNGTERYLKWSFAKSMPTATADSNGKRADNKGNEDIRFGYIMRCVETNGNSLVAEDEDTTVKENEGQISDHNATIRPTTSTSIASLNGVHTNSRFEWQMHGSNCSGMYNCQTHTLLFYFPLNDCTAVHTLRIVDQNTISVCIAEHPLNEMASIQLGTMQRMDLQTYPLLANLLTLKSAHERHDGTQQEKPASISRVAKPLARKK